MLKSLNKKTGFASIVEVVVTAVIFAMAAIAIFSTIAMFRPSVQTSSASSGGKLGAAYLGKTVIEDLQGQLDPAEWAANTGPLSTGTVHTSTVGGYTVDYELTEVPGDFPPGLAPRKLVMNVYYPQ